MIKKIFISIACFMLVLSCFFISPITANASTGQIYTYDDSEVFSDFSNMGDYAIKSVDSFNVKGAGVLKISFIPLKDYTLSFVHRNPNSSNPSFVGNLFICNFASFEVNDQLNCNFLIRNTTSSTDGITYKLTNSLFGSINGVNYYYRNITLSANNLFEIYFSLAQFNFSYSNISLNIDNQTYFIEKEFDSSYDLNSFIDMNSETNFTFGIFSDFLDFPVSSGNYYLSNFFKDFNPGGRLMQYLPYVNYSVSDLTSYSANDVVDCYLSSGPTVRFSGGYSLFYLVKTTSNVSYSNLNNNYSFYFSNFYFQINRPFYRTNNTLCLYNFDYDHFLNNVKVSTYRLEKDNSFYDCVYNGQLPNSKFIYIYNENIANILFDNYIYLFFSFSSVLEDFNFYEYLYIEDEVVFNSLGFDFNFTYFNEPLVSSNGSYNFDFQKPGYVDMPFSLAPFYLPILEAVQNALIFLLFYCPIISDILAFIHLDQFFGALFNIFSFETGNITLLGINMGSFIWACISFLIFFKLLRSFFPILWSSRAEASSSWSDLMVKPDNLKQKERIAHHKEIYRKHKEGLKIKRAEARALKKSKTGTVFRNYTKKDFDSLYDNLDDINL